MEPNPGPRASITRWSFLADRGCRYLRYRKVRSACKRPPDVPRAIPANPIARLLPLAMVVAARGDDGALFQFGRSRHAQSDVHVLPGDDVGVGAGHAWHMERAAAIAQLRSTRIDAITCNTSTASIKPPLKTANAQHHWRCTGATRSLDTLWTLVGSRRMWERRVRRFGFLSGPIGTRRAATLHQAGGARSRPTRRT